MNSKSIYDINSETKIDDVNVFSLLTKKMENGKWTKVKSESLNDLNDFINCFNLKSTFLSFLLQENLDINGNIRSEVMTC